MFPTAGHPFALRVAPLTFGPRSRLVSSPNVRGRRDTRRLYFFVFLSAPTFSLDPTAGGGGRKCRRRYPNVVKQPESDTKMA